MPSRFRRRARLPAAAAPPPSAADRRGLAALTGRPAVDPAQLPMLQLVIDRLARLLTASCRGIAGTAEVTADRARPVALKDFLAAATPPAMIAVIRIDPWGGRCLAALDQRLVAVAMDLLLGGRRNQSPEVLAAPRPSTALERVVLERLADDMIARDLERAFEPVDAVTCVLERLEITPSGAAIIQPGDAALGFRTAIAIDGRDAAIDFLIPLATLKPVRDRLAQAVTDRPAAIDAPWQAHLRAELPRTNVVLQAVVERRRISSAEVLRWRVGSSLALHRRHDDPIELFCNDLLVLRARIAERDGHIALHVEDRRIAGDWPVPAADATSV